MRTLYDIKEIATKKIGRRKANKLTVEELVEMSIKLDKEESNEHRHRTIKE